MFLRLFLFLIMSSCVFAYEVSIVAIFRDEAKYLKEWIDYHLSIGVEHFWLYNDYSEDNWEEVLDEYIKKGIVEVKNTDEVLEVYYLAGLFNYDKFIKDKNNKTYGYSRQQFVNQYGIRNAIGKTKWLAIIDIDEFLLPMREKTIQECLEKHFSDAEVEADAIFMNWRCFGTSHVTLPEGASLLRNLTSCSLKGHPFNSTGKTIMKPEKIDTSYLWQPHHFELLSKDGRYVNGNAQLLEKKDGKYVFEAAPCDRFLRVNHYVFRDEYFFWTYRMERAKTEDVKSLYLERYEAFNLSNDHAIQRLLD